MPTEAITPFPVFVGGTGRSGTTIVGELIGASPHYAMVPIEMRFHVDAGGLSHLARRRVSMAEFRERLLQSWYIRKPNANGPRGLHVFISRSRLDRALDRLEQDHPTDPWAACGAFLREVTSASLEPGEPQSSWVEMTPPNARAMHTLARMLPEARFIHLIRDGRDVASSVVRRSWGPNDMPTALEWWGDELIKIHRARERTDPARVMEIRLESLVGDAREAVLEEVRTFIGVPGDPEMKEFFDTRITREAARPGSWRDRVTAEEATEIEEHYRQQLARLHAEGVVIPEVR